MSDLTETEKLMMCCKTCKYHRMEPDSCLHSSADQYELSNRCLQRIKPHLRDRTPHPRYPNIKKRYNVHEYYYWEPKKEYDVRLIDDFLEELDFEI